MSKTAYHLQLKGFVGGADFDCKAVDNILEKNQGKQVNVRIGSTGGNLATGLSITSAFNNTDNVFIVEDIRLATSPPLFQQGWLKCSPFLFTRALEKCEVRK